MSAILIPSIVSANPGKWAEEPVAGNGGCLELHFHFIETIASDYKKMIVVADLISNVCQLG